MARVLVTRVAAGVATLVLVSVIVFAATEVLPGDVAQAILGREASPEALAEIRSRLRLDDPAPVRYGRWVSGVVRGDLGNSLATAVNTTTFGQVNPEPTLGVPVTRIIKDRLRNSLILMFVTSMILVPVALGLGTVAAIKRNTRVDRIISISLLGIISLPEFVLATVLIFGFALLIPVLPAVSLFDPASFPLNHPSALVLPVLTLLAAGLAHSVRMVRAGVMQILDAPYIQMASLKGLPRTTIWRRYILRNALAMAIPALALNIAYLFGGVVVVEAVYQYPGIGVGLLQALNTRDVPVIQAIVLVIATVYIVLNISSDVLTLVLTPKLKTGHQS